MLTVMSIQAERSQVTLPRNLVLVAKRFRRGDRDGRSFVCVCVGGCLRAVGRNLSGEKKERLPEAGKSRLSSGEEGTGMAVQWAHLWSRSHVEEGAQRPRPTAHPTPARTLWVEPCWGSGLVCHHKGGTGARLYTLQTSAPETNGRTNMKPAGHACLTLNQHPYQPTERNRKPPRASRVARF